MSYQAKDPHANRYSTKPQDRERTIAHRWLPGTRSSANGFTLLEQLVVILIISTLFAVAAFAWNGVLTTQRLNTGQERVYQAMRDAQSRAKQNRIVWQASFQDANGIVQWAVHPINTIPIAAAWSNLDATIQMDAETTLQQSGGVRRVQFDHEGHVNGQLGRLTLSSRNGGKAKRCVVVSTLLGAIRTGSEHSTMQDSKYCY
ncbi:MAG: Tfp pilus assembly protein FimT/FimU [Leptolyngbya sp. BL-A-14]